MKRILSCLPAILVCLFLNQTHVMASSHREAPLISNDPLADNTDVYAFRSPCDSNKVVLIANYIPFEHPAGGPNWITFGENIRYEIHVDNNAATPFDDVVYRFVFTHVNQDPSTFFNIRLGQENIKTTYTLTKSVGNGPFMPIVTNGIVPPNNIGPRSIQSGVGLGAANYETLITNAVANASGNNAAGETVFCGPSDDPFFVDLGGAFDLGGFRKPGPDAVAKSNTHSICIEVPIASLQKNGMSVTATTGILNSDYVIGVYASAYRREMTTLSNMGDKPTGTGNWIQVSRLGMPLTNEAVIPIGMKDKWNATLPSGDGAFIPYFKNPELALYMDDSQFGGAVPGLADLRIQSNSLGGGVPGAGFDFRNGKPGLFPLKGSPALDGTALSEANFGSILLPDNASPRAVDLLPIFYTGVPNLAPYQLATGKGGNPLAVGKPFINNFLPTLGDYLRLNMSTPVTPRNSPDFNSLGIVWAAVLGLTDPRFNADASIQNIPNMDGFPNGRRLEDDVTTIELQAVSGVALAAIGLWYDDYTGGPNPVTPMLGKVLGFHAGVTQNDTTFKACFPYVQAPWAGFTGAQFAGATPCGLPTDILYVDATLGTSGSGASWACGLKELSEAIKIANMNPAIKAIWVADGTYKPTNGTDRTISMTTLRADLKILGGFSGNETMATQANPSLNPTIISGDIGVANNMSDNSYRLLNIGGRAANPSGLVIDGFIFEKANADAPGDGDRSVGPAIHSYLVSTSTPVNINRTIFRNNYGRATGAIFLHATNATFDNCRFVGNTTNGSGGGVLVYQASPVFNSCVFAANTATNSGGGFYGNYGTASFSKTTFSGNSAGTGGGIYANRYTTNVYNSVFNANTSISGGGGMFIHNGSNSAVSNSTFFKNTAASSGGAIVLVEANSSINAANNIFYMNTASGKATGAGSDITNFTGGSNVYANNILQMNTAVPADNGGNIRNNTRGTDPMFVNEANAIGADMMWGTGDDGLALNSASLAKNTGDNALAPAGTDITNSPRIVCTLVDKGAYENQGPCGPVANEELFVGGVKPNSANGIVANPFNNDLQIRYMGTEKAGVSVSAISGKSMFTLSNIKQGITHVDASSWSSGMYEVVITTASGKRTNFKVVKL
jgi:predicted outer membrane repeat protein